MLIHFQGKPKSIGGSEENIYDCLGAVQRPGSDKTMSKYQMKKQRKLNRKNKRNGFNTSGKNNSKKKKCEEEEDESEICGEVKLRLTEQRRPGDEEFDDKDDPDTDGGVKGEEGMRNGESRRYRYLMAMRREERRENEDSDGDSSDEEEEYDHTEDSEGHTLDKDEEHEPDLKKLASSVLLNRLNSLTRCPKSLLRISQANKESSESEEEESDTDSSSSSSSAKEDDSDSSEDSSSESKGLYCVFSGVPTNTG